MKLKISDAVLQERVNPERTLAKRVRAKHLATYGEVRGHTCIAHPTKKLTKGRRWSAGLTRGAHKTAALRENHERLWGALLARV